MTPTGPPDAVMVPPSRIDETTKGKLYRELDATFPGGRLMFALDGHTGMKFGRLDVNQTRLHPSGHPLAKQERYDWYVADRSADGKWSPLMVADGDESEVNEILLGYLRPDPTADDPDVAAMVSESLDRRKAEARAAIDAHNEAVIAKAAKPSASPEPNTAAVVAAAITPKPEAPRAAAAK